MVEFRNSVIHQKRLYMPAKWHKYSYTAQREERRTFVLVVSFLVILIILFTLIHNNAVTMYRIRSDTMIPTLAGEQRIVSTPLYSTDTEEKSGFSLIIPSKRGDLVVISPANTDRHGRLQLIFRSFISFITFQRVVPFSSEDTPGKKPVIRRLLGYPGDTLYMDKGIVYIKPSGSNHFLTEFELVNARYELKIEALPDEWNNSLPFSDSFPEQVLGPDEYYVLCDNRIKAGDSRIWGPIPKDRIIGRVIARYWPFALFEQF